MRPELTLLEGPTLIACIPCSARGTMDQSLLRLDAQCHAILRFLWAQPRTEDTTNLLTLLMDFMDNFHELVCIIRVGGAVASAQYRFVPTEEEIQADPTLKDRLGPILLALRTYHAEGLGLKQKQVGADSNETAERPLSTFDGLESWFGQPANTRGNEMEKTLFETFVESFEHLQEQWLGSQQGRAADGESCLQLLQAAYADVILAIPTFRRLFIPFIREREKLVLGD